MMEEHEIEGAVFLLNGGHDAFGPLDLCVKDAYRQHSDRARNVLRAQLLERAFQ
jgi:hypothetical protein